MAPIRIGKCKNNGRHYKCDQTKCLNRKESVTELIDQVKEDICKNYCKYAEECEERLENGEELRKCPLDKL